MSGMDEMDGKGLAGMGVEEIVELAERLFCDGERTRYGHGFFGDGVMVATDSRILLRVWDKRIQQPVPVEKGREVPNCDKLEKTPRMAGGRGWVFGDLANAAMEEYVSGSAQLNVAMDEFLRENRWKIQKCPCCYGELVVEEDEVQSFEKYVRDNGPSRATHGGKVCLLDPLEGWRVVLDAEYLMNVIRWAREAGGLKGLFVVEKPESYSPHPVRFVGEGWEVLLMPIRDAGKAHEVVLPMVPAVRWRFAGVDFGNGAEEVKLWVREGPEVWEWEEPWWPAAAGGGRPTAGPRQDGDGAEKGGAE